MNEIPWWGYSKEHGWVVLDRTVPTNVPGRKEDLLFLRCRDSTTYVEKRKDWNPPGYSFAPNYLRNLTPAASADAAAELQVFQSQWPEYQHQIQQEQRAYEERAEAARLEPENQEKPVARNMKKQDVTSRQ